MSETKRRVKFFASHISGLDDLHLLINTLGSVDGANVHHSDERKGSAID
jgi:hypothetical protein